MIAPIACSRMPKKKLRPVGQAALTACTQYWTAPAQAATICALVQHEGTLFYPTGNPAIYTFNTSLAQGASFCQANANNPCAT